MKWIKSVFKLFVFLRKANRHSAWIQILDKLMQFAIDVQQHGKPMLTKIAAVDMSGKSPITNMDIVSIWAGVGDANPIERIIHLRNQNTAMKDLLKICEGKVKEDKDLWVNIKLVLDTFE